MHTANEIAIAYLQAAPDWLRLPCSRDSPYPQLWIWHKLSPYRRRLNILFLFYSHYFDKYYWSLFVGLNMLNAQQMHIRRIVTNSNNHQKKKILWFHHCIPNSTTTDSDTHIRLNITLTSLMFTNSELYQMQQCLHCRYIFNMVVNSDLSSTSLSFLI